MLDRRSFVLTSLALAATPASAADNPFAALEAQHGGRLGFAALDTATGNRMSWRANERFPMCSTFKLLAVSAVLSKADHGQEHLDRFVRYGQPDLLEYAPVTRRNVARHGMSLDSLCEAAISYSDNTAANLLLKSLGGPEAGTRFCRAIGDPVTRIDRFEPDANTCLPNDPRDTTTPQAMLADVHALLLGKVLAASSRQRLLTWLLNYRTRFPRIAAGLPVGSRSGHKMGTGANGTANDVAIVWPAGRAPVLIAAYYTGSTATSSEIDGVLAEVGRIVSAAFA